MDRNSIKNQEIKRKFVGNEIGTCVSTMVKYILQKGYEDREAPFTMDDLTNYYTDNSEKIEELEEKKNELQEQIDELETELEENEETDTLDNSLIADRKGQIRNLEKEISEIENSIEELEREQDEPNEVYEWWTVSNWLCGKLKAKGQVVLEDENIWGRCTTGQAILLDGVISDICEDLEILEGQKNEWKV